MNRLASLFAILVASTVAACAVDASDTTDGTEDVSQDDALTAAGKALVGAYTDDSGAFKGLVLTSERVGQGAKFFADVDTGIRCIKAPCPSTVRIEGIYTAGTKTITLRLDPNANKLGARLAGKYNYLVQGEKFSLSRKGFAQSLAKTISYCADETAVQDCFAQDLVIPACFGSTFSCSAERTCEWSCKPFIPPTCPPVMPNCGADEEVADLDGDGCALECRPAQTVTVQGTLFQSFGIGGENTGTSIQTATEFLELVLDDGERNQFVADRVARVKGSRVLLSGVETQNRPAIDVTELLVCPIPGTVLNCMPGPTVRLSSICSGEKRAWVSQNCVGVDYVD
jgi:hypothetical protein